MSDEPDVSISGWVRNGNESLCESDRNINGAMIGKFNNNEQAQKEIQKKYRSFLQNNKKDYNRRKSLFNYPIANVLSDENSVLLRNFKTIDLNSKLELIQNIENSLGTLNKGYRVGFFVKDKQLKENQMMQKSAEYHLKNFDFPKQNVNNPFLMNSPAHVHQQFVHTNLKQKHSIDQFVHYIQTLIAPNSISSKFNKILFDHQGLIKNKTNRIGFDRLIEQMEKDRKKFCEMIVKDGKSFNEIIQELYKQNIRKQNLDKNIDNNFLKKIQKKQKPDNKEDLYEQLENELKLQGMKMKDKISPSQSIINDPFQTIQTQTAIESKKANNDKISLERKESIIEPWQAGSIHYEKQSSKIDGKKEKVIDEYKLDSLIQCAVKEDSQNKIYQIYQTKNEKNDSQNNKDIQLEYDRSSYRKIGTAMGTDKSKIHTSFLNENDNKSPKTPKSPNISCNNIQNPQTQMFLNSNKVIKQDQNNEQKSSDTTLQTQLKLTFKHVQSFNKIPDIIKNSLIHKKKKKKLAQGPHLNDQNSNSESVEKKKLKRIYLNNNQQKQKQVNIIEELLKQEQAIKDTQNEKIYQKEIVEDAQYDDIQDQIKYFSENNELVKPKRSVQRAGSYINNTNFQFENVAIQEFRQRQNTEETFLQQNYLRQQLKKPSTPIMAKRLQNSRISIGKKRQTLQSNKNDPLSLGQIHLVGQNVQQYDQKQFQLLNMDYMSTLQQRNNYNVLHQNDFLSYQFSSSSGNDTANGKIQKQLKLQSLQNLQDSKDQNSYENKKQNILQISGQQFPSRTDNINGLVKWQPVELINHSLGIENRLKQEQLRQMIMNQHQIVQKQNQQSQNRLNQKQNISPMSGKEQNKCVQLSVKIDPIQSIEKENSIEYIKTTKGHRPSNENLEGHYNIKIQDDLEANQTNRKTQNYTELNRREQTNELNEEECNSEYRDPQSQMNNQITKKLNSKYPEKQQIFKHESKIQNSTFGTINQQEQNYQFESFQAKKQNEDLFKSSRINYMNENFIDQYDLTKNTNFEEHSNLRVKDFSNLLIKNVQQQDQAKEFDQNEQKQKHGISKMKVRKYLQSQNRGLHTADGQINPRRSKTPHYLQQQQFQLEPEQILQITPMSNHINQDKINLGQLYQAIAQKDEQLKNNHNLPQSAIILYQRNQQQKLQQLSQGSKALNGLLMQQNERQFIKPSLFIKRQNQLKKILQELNNRKALVIDESKIKQMIQNENFEQLLENPNQILESIRMKKVIDIEEQNFKQNDYPLETVSILSITQNKDLQDENIQPQYLKKNFIASPVSTITEILSGVGRTQIISKRNQSNESRSNESVNNKRNKIDKIQKIVSNTATHHYYQYNQDVGDVIHNYQVNKNQDLSLS